MEAVIYTRVSSSKQVSEGHGNDAQEHICRRFAESKGYTIVKVFKEPGISGATLDRPAMNEMLDFLRQHKDIVVVFDDLSRLTRDVGGWIELKKIVYECGARFDSPKHTIDDSLENDFVTTILVGAGELQRKQNARQVKDKMKARMERGYWPFPAALPGLQIVREPEHGKVMRRKEPEASIITQALEGYASGKFETQADVLNFLKPYRLYKTIRIQNVRRMLDRAILYAGYLEYEPWGVKITKGQHDALISYKTYEQIQERFTPRAYVRKYSPAFPLRGRVSCPCGHNLTAAFAKGKNKRYPYYWCPNKECKQYGKTISTHTLESDFEELLGNLAPSEEKKKEVMVTVQSNLDAMYAQFWDLQQALEKKEQKCTEQIQKLAWRAANASDVVAKVYEKEIEKLEHEKLSAVNGLTEFFGQNVEKFSYQKTLEHTQDLVSNPLKRWEEGDLGAKRTVLSTCFEGNLVYVRNEGFRTPEISLSYAYITGIKEMPVSVSGRGGN